MRYKLLSVVAALAVFFGAHATALDAQDAPQVSIIQLDWSVEEIEAVLTDFLPFFADFYDYDLTADLARAGLSLTDFAGYLNNYLVYHLLAGTMLAQPFDFGGDNWLFYFVDGIVLEMSNSPHSDWGNISLQGLVLNDIYFQALGLELMDAFFTHLGIVQLVTELDIAAYYDFLFRPDVLDAVMQFGPAARAYLTHGDTAALYYIIGGPNIAALSYMGNMMVLDFLAGLLISQMAPDISAVIAEYTGFEVTPAALLQTAVHITEDRLEYRYNFHFDHPVAFVVASDIVGANLNIFFVNMGAHDFWISVETFGAMGIWREILVENVAAGESFTRQLQYYEDFVPLFRVSTYSPQGNAILGYFAMRQTVYPL